MLNKLRYFQNRYYGCNINAANAALSSSAMSVAADENSAMVTLQKLLKASHIMYSQIERVTGGTLGITFLAHSKEYGELFVKTHLLGEKYRHALHKEYELMKLFYGGQGVLRLEELVCDERTYLVMDFLKPKVDTVTPQQVCRILNTLQNVTCNTNLHQSYTLEELIVTAQQELEVLFEHGFFTKSMREHLFFILSEFESRISRLSRCICHGDLSDKNVMMTEDQTTVLIDWEDAFLGIEGYDYLYWLTFFNHRKFYSKEIFFRSGCEEDVIKGILVTVLIIKSAISFYAGSYENNSLTFQERIVEILKYLEIYDYDK